MIQRQPASLAPTRHPALRSEIRLEPRRPVASQAPVDRLEASRALFHVSVEQGQQEARQVGDFFRRYPSRTGDQIVFAQTYWAQAHLFENNPLRGLLYHATSPIDEAGKPKNALWQAYVDAVDSEAPAKAVEEAALRAHVAEFTELVETPTFKKLYALADPDYRPAVQAYLDTLRIVTEKLDAGEDPVQVARSMTRINLEQLVRRGAPSVGMELTWEGVKAIATPTDDLSRHYYRSVWQMGMSFLFDRQPGEGK